MSPASNESTHPPQAVAVGDINVCVPAWREKLLDLVGGSALWDVAALQGAAVDLTAAHPSGVAQLFAGRRAVLSNLVREGSALTVARKNMRKVIARRDELTQLYGLAGTYVAMGVASWKAAPDDEEDPSPNPRWQIPVFLRGVHVRPIEGTAEYELELAENVTLNSVLTEQLEAAGVVIDAESLIDLTGQAHGFTPAPAYSALEQAGSELMEFEVEPTIVLGTFVHPGQALADDLDVMHRRGMNDLVRSLAGEIVDGDSHRPLPAMRLADPDPHQERGVGDMDLSEHRLLDGLAGGSSVVVDTPPGSDAAAAVVKVAAWAAAEGKRVVYLPGSRRSAQGVLDAATAMGVADFFLDLAHNPQWPAQAAAQIVDSMNPPEVAIDTEQVDRIRRELVAHRERLSGYIRALHTARAPWQTSAYSALQALAELTAKRPGPRTQVQLDGQVVRTFTAEDRAKARTLLGQASDLGAFRLRASDTAWYGAQLTGAEHANKVMALVQDLHAFFPELQAQVAASSAQTGLDEATTMGEWLAQLELLDGIAQSLDQFLPQIFERSVAPMAAATGSRKWRTENNIDLAWSQRRHLRKQAKDMVRPAVHISDLHGELMLVAQRRELWRAQCAGGGWPQLPERLAAMRELAEAMKVGLEELNPVLSPTLAGADLFDLPLTDLGKRLARLADDDETLRQMPQRADILAQLRSLGLGALVEDLTSRRVGGELVVAEFELAWWSSVLDQMLSEDEALVGLESDGLVATAQRLSELDSQHIETLAGPLHNRVRDQIVASIAADRPAAQDFYRAVIGGQTDLAQLARFGDIVWRPRPVWIIPPMVVPQVLSPTEPIDLVIVDAAARLPAEHAVPLIARGRQAVILGDQRQATPDSLLSAAQLWPSMALNADRVDLDESIAAFLSEHGYADVVPVVPGPQPAGARGQRSLHFHSVNGTGMPALGKVIVESVKEEVDFVVDLVIDHALTTPERSLAVVALNPTHAQAIREGIGAGLSQSTSLRDFLDPANTESFTVVDVSDAAGLRRDAIILSVGYGKTPHGRILHNFGSISAPHGEGLMVNAVQAARSSLTVVSSFTARELDPARMRSAGARMLHDLLVASAAGRVRQEPPASHPEEDRLLLDVAERLWRLGVHVVPQYGWQGGMRIALAAGHAKDRGRLSVAVVTDDEEYVSQASMRTLERHWPGRLERRGWHICRVYSSAVFLDPQGEAERIKALVDQVYEAAQQAAASAGAPIVPPARITDDFESETPGAEPSYGQLRIDDRGELIVGATTTTIPKIVADEVRGVRPPITPGLPLSAYGDDELDHLATWISADNKKRSDEEFVAELQAELGLERSSQHTRAILAAVVKRQRGSSAPSEPSPAGGVQDSLLDEEELRGGGDESARDSGTSPDNQRGE